MSWRDRMGPATFRGVAFVVDTAEFSGGRRTVRHEYPLRDRTYSEDLGRKPRSFPVEGFVVGDDYIAARDALVAVLEQEGPGELIHPHYGTRQVAVATFRLRESSAEGGMARFSIEFEETDAQPSQPVAAPAAAPRVAAGSAATLASVRARLAGAGVGGILALSADAVANASAMVGSAITSMRATLSPVVSAEQDLASLKLGLDNLALDASGLVRQPALVLDGFVGVLGSFASTSLPALAIRALLSAYGFSPSSTRPPATTASRAAEQEAYDQLLWAIQASMVVTAATQASQAIFDSYDAALAARVSVADALDALLDGADDETFTDLQQLRSDLAQAVPGENQDLPRLLQVTPAYTVPSLVLAHQLYGDVSLEADLVARNSVSKPGFMPGGVMLEVLSD